MTLDIEKCPLREENILLEAGRGPLPLSQWDRGRGVPDSIHSTSRLLGFLCQHAVAFPALWSPSSWLTPIFLFCFVFFNFLHSFTHSIKFLSLREESKGHIDDGPLVLRTLAEWMISP